MASLMERGNLLFLFADNAALFLRTDSYLDKRIADIIGADICAVGFCSPDGGLIQQVFQVGPCKSCRCLRNLL